MKLPYLIVLGCVSMITGCMSMSKHEGVVREMVANELGLKMDEKFQEYIGSNCENFEQHYPEFKAAILGTVKK